MRAGSKRNGAAAPIGVVLNGHREGQLLAHTLESLSLAREEAAERGLGVDIHLILDRADEATIAVADRYAGALASCEQVTFGNLGASRAAGLANAHNEWIAFLDGDDLISRNWLHAAHAHAASAARPRDTVFHTEMFVGFGAEVFFRRAMRSEDPEFDPLCLIADWFFCNNLFAHRSIFERCPIEPYDHEKGLGSEDWHWSCQTAEAGFARDFAPGTIYFYRMKPPSQSLGMAGGLMHKASRLFSRESVSRLAAQAPPPGIAESPNWTPAPDTPRFRREVPEWVSELALDQARVDAQVVEIARFMKANPAARTFPPRIHYGAAEFYRRSAPRLTDAGGKIALFWGEAQHIGGPHFLSRVIAAIRQARPSGQIVVFSEFESLAAEAIDARYGDEDVLVLDYAAARARYKIPEVYLAMLTGRYFLQFDFDLIVNVGSHAFDEVLTRFERTIAHRCASLLELMPFITFDRADPSFDRIVEALPHRARFEHRVVCLSETMREFMSSALLAGGDVRFERQLRAAIKDSLRVRWSGEPARMASAYQAADFSALLTASRKAKRRAAPAEQPYRDLAVVLLAGGACPELAPVQATARAAGAALHVFTSPAHEALLRRRAQGLGGAVLVHALPAWTVAAVAEAMGRVDATWVAVLEPGAVVTPEFLDQGVNRLRHNGGAGAVAPEAVMRKRGHGWELLQLNEGRVSVEGKQSMLFGGLDPIGAVVYCALGASAALDPSVRAASAALFPNVVALAASREQSLFVAAQTSVLNLLGTPWPMEEWARLIRPPDWAPGGHEVGL